MVENTNDSDEEIVFSENLNGDKFTDESNQKEKKIHQVFIGLLTRQ